MSARRECSRFFGDNERSATVWQDLITREYIVERHGQQGSGFNNRYDNLADAEDSAEDWVMPQ